MEDDGIVALYFARNEQALEETAKKYGADCHAVSYQILRSHEDAEECVNDTYIRAWNAMPPQRPTHLRTFLLKIARNLSLTAYQAARTQKRGGGQVLSLTQELSDCVTGNPEATLQKAELTKLLDSFLMGLPDRDRYIFLRRYWHGDTVAEVAARCHIATGTAKSSLFRSRQKLYRRGDRTLLGSYSYAATVGDDLVIAQENGSDRMTLFNASGDIVAEDIALQTELFSHVWQGHGYLSALDSQGRVGLMDSTGSWAIAPEMNYIFGISNGYALCVLEDGSYRAISLEDGTTFDCAYGICDVYDQGLILELDETAFHYGTVLFTENAYEQFVSWDGTVLAEGNRIQVLDDEGDGNAELVLVTDGNTARLFRPDGSLLRELDYSMGSFATISSQTFLCMNNTQASDGSWYMDVFLLNTETGETFRDFDKPYSYGSDLWFSVDSWGRYTTHLFYAQYQDEEGNYHTDLLDESGKVLLTDLVSQYSHQDGGVFTVLRDGKPALMRLDGTLLYQSS